MNKKILSSVFNRLVSKPLEVENNYMSKFNCLEAHGFHIVEPKFYYYEIDGMDYKVDGHIVEKDGGYYMAGDMSHYNTYIYHINMFELDSKKLWIND
jgi:hypothetical protein